MRVLLLGATGNLGRYILQHLIELRHDVVVYARDLDKLATVSKELGMDISSCTLVKGSVQDSEQLASVMATCSSCIMSAGRPDTPSSADQLSTLFPPVLAAARAHLQSPRRFIALAGMGLMPAPTGILTAQLPGFPSDVASWTVTHEVNHKALTHVQGESHGLTQWAMLCPAFMTHGLGAYGERVAITLEHAPYYDPTSIAGRTLSYLPSLFSMLALGAFILTRGEPKVPYAAVARTAALLATAKEGGSGPGQACG